MRRALGLVVVCLGMVVVVLGVPSPAHAEEHEIRVEGTVVDQIGSPVEGATVEAVRRARSTGGMPYSCCGSAVTDAEGHYAFVATIGEEGGRNMVSYDLDAKKDGYWVGGGVRGLLTASNPSVTSDFTLVPAPHAPTDVQISFEQTPDERSAWVQFVPDATTDQEIEYWAMCEQADGSYGGSGWSTDGYPTEVGMSALVDEIEPGVATRCHVRGQHRAHRDELTQWSDWTEEFYLPEGPPTIVDVKRESRDSVRIFFRHSAFAAAYYDGRCTNVADGSTSWKEWLGDTSIVVGSWPDAPLVPGQSYTCTVRAVAADGTTTDWSAPSAIYRLPSDTPPSDVRLTKVGPTTAGISFTPGTDGLSYQLRCRGVSDDGQGFDHDSEVTAEEAADGYLEIELDPTASYTCALRSLYLDGFEGEWSPSSAPFRFEDRRLTGVRITSAGNRAMRVTVRPYDITVTKFYEASCRPRRGEDAYVNNAAVFLESGTAAPAELVLRGLLPGQTYQCSVRAATYGDPTPWSAWSASYRVPAGSPTQVTATRVEPRAVRLGFKLTNFVPVSYQGRCASSTGVRTGTSTVRTRLVVRGLVRGVRYVCRVRALGPDGTTTVWSPQAASVRLR